MNCYNLAGTIIGFNPSPSPIESIIEANFRLCSKTEQPPDLRFSGSIVEQNEFLDSLPDWLAQLTKHAPIDTEPFMSVTPEGIAVVVNTPESMSCAWLSQDMDALHFIGSRQSHMPTPVVVQPLIAPLLREIKLRSGQLLLHAAVTYINNATGVLVAAPGYGGKTTTTMSLVRLGAKLLGDDLTAVHHNGTGIRAMGIPEPFNLTPKTMAYFKECRHIIESIGHNASEKKIPVPPTDIYGPDCLLDQCPLHLAYFVRIDDQGPFVRRMGTREALEQFAAAHMFVRKQTIPPKSADGLLDMVAGMKVYELHTGPDPVALGRWITSNLERHLNG